MAERDVRLLVGGAFAAVSLILLGVAAALVISSAGFASAAERTVGTVVDLDYASGSRRSSGGYSRVAYPHVTYVNEADRREYTFRDDVGSNPPAYAVGERVSVLYDPDRPGDARIDSWANRFLGASICGGLGVVFGTIGALLLIAARRRARRSAWLRDHGRERWVAVGQIDQDFGVRVNGRSPFVVRASWRDERSGRIHTASSDHLWEHPGPVLMDGRPVRVLFDPADPDRNLVDL
jgi:hypothetical protein